MAITTVSDAVVLPQAKGTGLSSEDDAIDAAGAALLASHLGGEYVGYGLEFDNHNASNDTVDILPGFCYVLDDSTSTSGSRSANGNAQLQSTNDSGYDTELPGPQVYVVLIPSTVTVSCTDSTLNQVWVDIANVSQNNAVEIRTDGGGGTTAEPSGTYLKLGETNPDDFSQDVRSNDVPQLDADADTVDGYQGSDLAKISRFPLPNSDLQNNTITVAGQSIPLGGSSSISHADLSSIGATDHHSTIQISDSGTPVLTQPTDINLSTGLSVTNDGDGTLTVTSDGGSGGSYSDEQAQDAVGTILTTDFTYDDAAPSISLSADSVTVAGNTVSLGSSTNVSHADLSAIGLEDHHNQIDIRDSGTSRVTQPTDINFDSNLSVADDGDGTVTVDASSGSSVSASDDGTPVVDPVGDFNFGTDLNVTDDGDGTVTVDSTASVSGSGADTVVTSASNLQSALNNNDVVRVKGVLDMTTTTTPVTVPDATTLYGYGSLDFATTYGDVLDGDVPNPLLEVQDDAHVYGLALYNMDEAGTCIRDSQAMSRYYNLDIRAAGTGIAMTHDGTGNSVESKVFQSRITGDNNDTATAGMQTTAIDVADYTDCEIDSVIIRGCNIGVKVGAGATTIHRSHMYNGEIAGSVTGKANIFLPEGNGGSPYVTSNYLEGLVDTNILIETDGNVADNIQIVNNQIRANVDNQTLINWDRSVDGFGSLGKASIKDNLFGSVGSHTGIDGIVQTGVSNVGSAQVKDNIFDVDGTENELRTENFGTATASGDGSSTSFSFPHGLFAAQGSIAVDVTPKSADAAGEFYVTTGSTNITVTYSGAPASGTDNLSWDWQAEVLR